MYTYPPSPIFIRPSFPSIQSTPVPSKDITPATSPPGNIRKGIPLSERSKSTDATISTSSFPKHRVLEDQQAWQQHTTSPPMVAASPWYIQSRNNLQALHLHIPCSAYTSTHRLYLQQHPSKSSAQTALSLMPNCAPYPGSSP